MYSEMNRKYKEINRKDKEINVKCKLMIRNEYD